jgi:polyisoprenoid-binding protein YceI
MYFHIKKYSLTLALLVAISPFSELSASAQDGDTSSIRSWQIVSGSSQLNFTATLNGAPVSGTFKQFSGDIKFDPAQLDKCSVNIKVSMDSINSTNPDAPGALKSKEWFDVKDFPEAIYTATQFTKGEKNDKGADSYVAKGNLTMHGITSPLTLTFTLDEFTPSKAIVNGSTSLQRSLFSVGQGEWADTEVVKDDVKINFKVIATNKK